MLVAFVVLFSQTMLSQIHFVFVAGYFGQYDIRIWNDVYKAAIKEANNAAKKERTKRKLYAGADNPPEDVEISMDMIKRNVPLKRVINRRYREFMELHNRLTGGKLSSYMKGDLKLEFVNPGLCYRNIIFNVNINSINFLYTLLSVYIFFILFSRNLPRVLTKQSCLTMKSLSRASKNKFSLKISVIKHF